MFESKVLHCFVCRHQAFILLGGIPTCGGIQTSSTGLLSSVDSDGTGFYDNNRDCLWTLVAEESKRIELQVLSMDTERDPSCSYDFLEVRIVSAPV